MQFRYTIWIDEVDDKGLTKGSTLCSARYKSVQEAEGGIRRLTEVAEKVAATRGDISGLKAENKDIDFYD